MKKLFLLIILFYQIPILAQKQISGRDIIAVAIVVKNECTNKAHNTHFFTFKVIKVLSGETTDTIIRSQEIAHYFGARQIISKIYIDKKASCSQKEDQAREVIIKYTYIDSPNNKKNAFILWVAKKQRMKSLEALELLFEKRKTKEEKELETLITYPSAKLLQEYDGKLFFQEKGTSKIALEVNLGSGVWLIGKIEKEDIRQKEMASELLKKVKDGKILFKEDNKDKVAFEIHRGSGYWEIAVID